MKTINVALKKHIDDSYDILIDNGHLEDSLLKEIGKASPTRITIVTDSNLDSIYHSTLEEIFDKAKIPYQIVVFEAGEKNKHIDTIMEMFEAFAEFKMDRKSLTVAFGGGVTGDMAGFLSGIYLRGIPFIQIPTSILSMVDSSVGGKTGVDTPSGKNLAGVFHQPKSVLIDTKLLKTLPKAEFINGMGEVIKHGLIRDKDLITWLEDNRSGIMDLDNRLLNEMIETNCRIKAEVVELDEKESGLRQILNLGHTFGHAIEHVSHFKIPHGYSIALGTLASASLSLKKGLIDKRELDTIVRIYKNFQMLDHIPELKKLDRQHILDAARADKKNVSGAVKIVLLNRIGSVLEEEGDFSFAITESEFHEAIDSIFDLV